MLAEAIPDARVNRDIQAIERSLRRRDQLSGSSGSREGVGTAMIDVAEVNLMVPGVLWMSSMVFVEG